MRSRWLAASFALVAGACAATAPPVQTTAKIVSSDSKDTSAYLAYRDITRDDFRAVDPPEHASEHATHLGALLCGAITPNAEIEIDFEPDVRPSDTWFKIRGPNYRAKMDPHCSWWNAQSETPADYVLEHEQIHFALIEIYARDINRELATLRIRTGSRELAPAAAEQSTTRLLERATRKLVDESRLFDHQTSRPVDRAAQRQWKRDVERRLGDSV